MRKALLVLRSALLAISGISLATGFLAVPAAASTVTYEADFTLNTGASTVVFPAFDPDDGTLGRVDLTISGTMEILFSTQPNIVVVPGPIPIPTPTPYAGSARVRHDLTGSVNTSQDPLFFVPVPGTGLGGNVLLQFGYQHSVVILDDNASIFSTLSPTNATTPGVATSDLSDFVGSPGGAQINQTLTQTVVPLDARISPIAHSFTGSLSVTYTFVEDEMPPEVIPLPASLPATVTAFVLLAGVARRKVNTTPR